MAYYGKQSGTQPRTTGKPCDICGFIPVKRWHKHHDHSTFVHQLHSQNRIKIDPYYANHPRVNRPDLANKMLCSSCAEKLIFQPLNQ